MPHLATVMPQRESSCPLTPSTPSVASVLCRCVCSVSVPLDPPVLVDKGEVRKRENEELNMDMADPDSPLAFPFPSQVSWTKDGEEVEDVSSTRVFNYSSILIGSVQRSDSGVYLLSATNYQLDGSPLDTDTASLTLNVLCECAIVLVLHTCTT